MVSSWVFAGLMALCWGIVWAAVLQFTEWGRWAAIRRTWLTVVIGVGGVLAIAFLVVEVKVWLGLVGLFSLASAGIIARSLANEWRDEQ